MVTTLPGRLLWPLAHAKILIYSHENASEVKSISLSMLVVIQGWETSEMPRLYKKMGKNSHSCPLHRRACPTWWDETQPSKAHSKTGGPLCIAPKHVIKAQWQHANKCQAHAEGLCLSKATIFPLISESWHVLTLCLCPVAISTDVRKPFPAPSSNTPFPQPAAGHPPPKPRLHVIKGNARRRLP